MGGGTHHHHAEVNARLPEVEEGRGCTHLTSVNTFQKALQILAFGLWALAELVSEHKLFDSPFRVRCTCFLRSTAVDRVSPE